jgi:hypothetical protein
MSADNKKDKLRPRAPSLWSKWTGARFRRQWLNRKWLVDLLSVIWPSSMRISDSRRNGGFLQQYQGIAFVACVFLAFMQAGLIIGHTTHESAQVYPDVAAAQQLHDSAYQSPSIKAARQPLMEHPIPKLMIDAEDKFRALLSKQSRSLSAAVKEYKRRYHQDPPKGFDEWWKFVKKNNVKMVDEYDGLVDDLAPFWAISGEELRRRAIQVSFHVVV